jgi:hypothetical protein
VLVGVQSRGTTAECADIDTLVLSTKAAEFTQWIAETMARHDGGGKGSGGAARGVSLLALAAAAAAVAMVLS